MYHRRKETNVGLGLGYFGIFIWTLVMVLTFAWINFNHPTWLTWKPQTFAQFCLWLIGAMLVAASGFLIV